MNWIDTPPCGRMDVKTATDTLLELTGPSTGARAAGAGAAAFGATFAGFAMRFTRFPIPGPFKLIPIALGLAGGTVAALGLGTAIAKSTIVVSRRGVELRWRWGPLPEKELLIPREDVKAVELSSHTHQSTDDWGHTRSWTSYRLNVVTKDGRAQPIEEFGLSTQAQVRKEQVERLIT